MNRREKEPIAAGDVAKIITWIIAIMVGLGTVSASDGEALEELSPILAEVAVVVFTFLALAVNVAIAKWQRGKVTPWSPDNELVRYMNDEELVAYRARRAEHNERPGDPIK